LLLSIKIYFKEKNVESKKDAVWKMSEI